ncbi:MAG: hypothetical protein P1U77_17115 [Rubripirellula sp.]|nr:hypothetical protein [Rubripirellula sp.]
MAVDSPWLPLHPAVAVNNQIAIEKETPRLDTVGLFDISVRTIE